MTANSGSSSLSRTGPARPRAGLLLALGVAVAAFVFVQVRAPFWEAGDEAVAPIYFPRLSLIGFGLAESEGDPTLVVRLKNTGEAAALEVSVALQNVEVSPAGLVQGGDKAGKVSVGPGEEASFDLGRISDHLLQWQATCAGCYFLGLGKSEVMPVEALAGACSELINKGKSCRLDYRLKPATINLRFQTADGLRVEGVRPVFVYLSQTAESSFRIPKY